MTLSSRQRKLVEMIKAGDEDQVIMQFTGFSKSVIQQYRLSVGNGHFDDADKPVDEPDDVQGGLW